MGLGGIQVWQLVIILIVFLVTLIAAVPFRHAAGKNSDARSADITHREKDGSSESR